eukprot:TRINITY_DN2912_c0_g2_i1.p3 TRINITY_DN2912_c0_g2~~TRINITY_DN2912_c0_g2_i1.p3  ORF type:complete len:152 (-),score=29.41 TRINITY_DN2912_c0_g2_i1:231-686(-)
MRMPRRRWSKSGSLLLAEQSAPGEGVAAAASGYERWQTLSKPGTQVQALGLQVVPSWQALVMTAPSCSVPRCGAWAWAVKESAAQRFGAQVMEAPETAAEQLVVQVMEAPETAAEQLVVLVTGAPELAGRRWLGRGSKVLEWKEPPRAALG